jgi:DNA-binding transcriptional LysR family regulator
MNISLRQLQAFVAVAKYQSFTKAADKIHVTQAGLSAMIRELEAHLGGRLFARTTRSVELNEMGKSFLPFALRTVADFASTVVELGLLQSQTRRHLRVGITPFIAGSIIPSVLDAFGQRAPDVAVSVLDTDFQTIQRLVESGEIDAGFNSFFTDVPGISRKLISRVQLVLVSQASLKQKASRDSGSAPWSLLESSALISLPEDNPLQILVESHLKKLNITPAARTKVTHLDTVIAFVEAGRGMAILPSFVFAACSRHRVHVRLLQEPEVLLNFYCITRAGRDDLDTINRFTDCFVATASQIAPAGFLPSSIPALNP